MFAVLLTMLINNTNFELIKSKSKQETELTLEEKIDILAWRTEIMAQVILELDDKVNYIINHYDHKTKTNVSNRIDPR
jgi:hypothetical protein